MGVQSQAKTPLRILPSAAAIGEHVAENVLERIARAKNAGKRFLLGCPTGRTPKPIFAEMARRLAESREDISHVTLVMMDEYLVSTSHGLDYASATYAWSCHHFAQREIAQRLNANLPRAHRLWDESIWFPDPQHPAAYEKQIADAGGIDYFLLASGASDGHVAFNPPGSSRDSRTRVIPLSEDTRRDNLQTFPTFGTLDNVPRHGVSVGIATILESKEAAMIVWGASKGLTLSRIAAAASYEPDWPATLIHECARREIICDADAHGARARVAGTSAS